MSKEFAIGSKVRVVALPPYVKTAEPMPMLRPPDVIYVGEEGIVLDRRPGGYWGIRFSKGAFLLDSQYIESVESLAESQESENGNEKL
ncbi:regulatory protein SipA [Scytonema sp. PCC 10023]|uniref:regulatory protein SipA n=1 Tax=Scytonema sp. PCC 10023 TaxID=1680591 RepID=UPI0039C65F00